MIKMNEETKKYLDLLNKTHPNFLVQSFIDFPKPWVKYDTPEYYEYIKTYGDVNHREILPEEIIIDVDSDTINDGIKHADIVESMLLKKKIKYKRYASGGTGQHFHLICNDILKIEDTTFHKNRIKYFFIEYILGIDVLKPKNLKSHICLANKKLIQIEYAKHRKGGIKTLLSGDLQDNKIPIGFYSYLLYKINERKKINERIYSLPEQTDLNCINYLEGKTINDENYFNNERINFRAVFALSSYYYRQDANPDSILSKLIKWKNNIPSELISNSRTELKQIKQLSNNTRGFVGCSYRMDLLSELQKTKVCEGCPYFITKE